MEGATRAGVAVVLVVVTNDGGVAMAANDARNRRATGLTISSVAVVVTSGVSGVVVVASDARRRSPTGLIDAFVAVVVAGTGSGRSVVAAAREERAGGAARGLDAGVVVVIVVVGAIGLWCSPVPLAAMAVDDEGIALSAKVSETPGGGGLRQQRIRQQRWRRKGRRLCWHLQASRDTRPACEHQGSHSRRHCRWCCNVTPAAVTTAMRALMLAGWARIP